MLEAIKELEKTRNRLIKQAMSTHKEFCDAAFKHLCPLIIEALTAAKWPFRTGLSLRYSYPDADYMADISVYAENMPKEDRYLLGTILESVSTGDLDILIMMGPSSHFIETSNMYTPS